MRSIERWAAWAAAALMSLATASVHAAGPAACSVKTRSAQLIVLICTRDAGDQVWRVRSQAACEDRSRCNVWIWEERAKAPETVPLGAEEVATVQADAAVAVWLNESQTLIKLRGRR